MVRLPKVCRRDEKPTCLAGAGSANADSVMAVSFRDACIKKQLSIQCLLGTTESRRTVEIMTGHIGQPHS